MAFDQQSEAFLAILNEVAELSERIAHDTQRRGDLYKLTEAYLNLFPDLRQVYADHSELIAPIGAEVPETTARPRGREAVRRVLVEFPGRSFTVKEMVKALRERGWLPDTSNPNSPSPAVRTALERLSASNPAFHKGGLNGYAAWSYQPNAEVA